ncbi:hypothetical protein [uncultured Megamonas sp.]|uniref:hypothetical protein n=1 Tax=uncultured Megamonas sp. TaxID=286140 RepID=UPI0026702D12|nr:hypothetical protein [uncultured Megamonas sp.]
MKAKNYVKVGLVISIILHVGIFALGGYVMNNITKEISEKTIVKSSDDEDITYVDIGITQDNEPDDVVVEPTEEINSQSEVVVDKEDLEKPKPPVETIDPPEDKKEKKEEPVVKKEPRHKFRTYKDTNIVVKEISKENLILNFSDVKDSKDLMPTYKHKEKPVYDYNLVPEGEAIIVVVEYIMDEQGKVIQAYPVLPAEKSDLGLSEEEYQDLNTACIQALEKYEIIPPKDKRGNIPQQEKFILTHDGAVEKFNF